jgi:hypothetical protein
MNESLNSFDTRHYTKSSGPNRNDLESFERGFTFSALRPREEGELQAGTGKKLVFPSKQEHLLNDSFVVPLNVTRHSSPPNWIVF